MSFNIALSGIRAASQDLEVTGNNIANSSTNGFKESRTEFGDVYTASIGNSGTLSAGSGVRGRWFLHRGSTSIFLGLE